MTITNGPSKNKLPIYDTTKPLMDTEEPIWREKEDNVYQIIEPILTIDMSLSLKPPKEDMVMSNFLQNLYSNPFVLGDVVIMQY